MAAGNVENEVVEGRVAPMVEADYGVLAECIGYNLRIAYARASQIFAQEFGAADLAPIQFAALEFISQNPDLSQRQIAKAIGTTPTVLVKPLDRLEKKGLISRLRAVSDRRRSRVRVTEAGERLMESARSRIRWVEDRLTETLSQDERDTLLRLLGKLLAEGPGSPETEP